MFRPPLVYKGSSPHPLTSISCPRMINDIFPLLDSMLRSRYRSPPSVSHRSFMLRAYQGVLVADVISATNLRAADVSESQLCNSGWGGFRRLCCLAVRPTLVSDVMGCSLIDLSLCTTLVSDVMGYSLIDLSLCTTLVSDVMGCSLIDLSLCTTLVSDVMGCSLIDLSLCTTPNPPVHTSSPPSPHLRLGDRRLRPLRRPVRRPELVTDGLHLQHSQPQVGAEAHDACQKCGQGRAQGAAGGSRSGV